MNIFYDVRIKSETGFCPKDFLKKVFGEEFWDKDGLEIKIPKSECHDVRKSLRFEFYLEEDDYFDLEEKLQSASIHFPDLKIFFLRLDSNLFAISTEFYLEELIQNGEITKKYLNISRPKWENSEDEEIFEDLKYHFF